MTHTVLVYILVTLQCSKTQQSNNDINTMMYVVYTSLEHKAANLKPKEMEETT
jgi:hypothetical protein